MSHGASETAAKPQGRAYMEVFAVSLRSPAKETSLSNA